MPRGSNAGRPKGSLTGPQVIHIMSSDEMILRKYPKALLGLIRARQTAGLTNKDCAEIIGVKNADHYGKVEKGQCELKLTQARKLALALRVKIDDFFAAPETPA